MASMNASKLKAAIEKELAAQSQHTVGETNKPKSVLEQAHNIIHGDREQTYGNAGKNLRTIAKYWSVHLSASTGQEIELNEQDVCSMMVLLKQARLTSNPNHEDSMVDICGYTALNAIVSQEKNS